ncbi:hypothetical protein ACQ4LE_002682 [Meloidogyne hapla]
MIGIIIILVLIVILLFIVIYSLHKLRQEVITNFEEKNRVMSDEKFLKEETSDNELKNDENMVDEERENDQHFAAQVTTESPNEAKNEDHYFSSSNSKLSQKNAQLSTEERNIIAHHECSHTVISHILGFPLQKVTLTKKDHFLGLTLYDNAGKLIWPKDECMNLMVALLSSAAGETYFFKCTSTAVNDDLEKAMFLAHSMVVHYGMTEIGPYSSKYFDSEYMKKKRDEKAEMIFNMNWTKAQSLVEENHKVIKKLVPILLERNELEHEELLNILRRIF